MDSSAWKKKVFECFAGILIDTSFLKTFINQIFCINKSIQIVTASYLNNNLRLFPERIIRCILR